MAEKQEKSSTNIKERSDGFIHILLVGLPLSLLFLYIIFDAVNGDNK